MSNYRSNNNRRPRRRKKDLNFQPSPKLQAVWEKLAGYGVWTHDRDGIPYEWAQSRKQCNIKLQEVQQKFNLSELQETRDSLLSPFLDFAPASRLYNGRLEENLTPIQLRGEIYRVQMIRTLLLASDGSAEELARAVDELDALDNRSLSSQRGQFRDRIWGEDRARLQERINKAIAKRKAKGEIETVKKGKGKRKRGQKRQKARV